MTYLTPKQRKYVSENRTNVVQNTAHDLRLARQRAAGDAALADANRRFGVTGFAIVLPGQAPRANRSRASTSANSRIGDVIRDAVREGQSQREWERNAPELAAAFVNAIDPDFSIRKRIARRKL